MTTGSAKQGTAAESVWRGRYAGVTIGAVALIFLAAVESLAVTTVMPIVSADLHGESLYAVAFGGTLATGVIGMVAAGAWSDRSGPRAPLYAATGLFIVGLVIAGLATEMPVLLVGRLVQGLGAGAQTVALYVVVARFYPSELHGRIFAAFAAAWVVPSMVGPFLAGAVTEYLHWRWTFLGVAVLVAIAFFLVAGRLRGVDLGGGDPDRTHVRIAPRLLLASMVAVAAVGVGLAVDAPSPWPWPLALAAIVVIGIAIRPLLPHGALRAARGLPSVVLLRGMIAGAFFAAEAYIPYLLMDRFGFSPTWAGLALTAAALAWAGASAVQGRHGDALGSTRIALIGIGLVLVAIGAVAVAALSGVAPWVVVVGWGLGGGGMGLLYPRLTVLTLGYSSPGNEGFNSSALSISDSTGSAVTIAVAGLAFAAAGAGSAGFVAVFAIAGALVLLALLPGLRLGSPSRG
ncbi:MFS family permease [Microbacterium resistens]|uniref:MFS family permease n=1 Tax=Microbacterium resistens TaxID=156977 RepID=A0ABU1SF95_9MICO|nr:MFS transporter [Microbacterium resistens]MDR6868269.1 MFS family permease [Microbacterium resistens]